jgi:tetratricopeptide (TPR) repeat protein
VRTAAAILIFVAALSAQHDHPATPLPKVDESLRGPLLLIRQGKTQEARKELSALLAAAPQNAELHYQMARSHLADFYSTGGRMALSLAMEALASALNRDPDHIPALKAKAIIHARAELLYYDPNLAYALATRVARLQPSASEYLLSLTDWLSGEVRFTAESGHRVPHDPLLGLDRSIELLDRVIDSSIPHSNEEAAGFYQMAQTLAKRGGFREAIDYFQLALSRPALAGSRGEVLREMAASYYRMGDYAEAARTLYRALSAHSNPIDQWMLKATLDRWSDPTVRLPDTMVFPAADAKTNVPGIKFKDIAPEMAANRRDGNGTCAFGDFTGNGRFDLILAGSGTLLAAYRNEGGRFRDVTAHVGLAGVPSSYSVNLVDYDNDGRLDLYLSYNGWNGPMKNRLYRNVDGRFEDVTERSGAGDPGSGFVSLWGDLDNDGYLDLVIANGVLKDGSLPQIYRNKGDGTFENVTARAGLDEPPTHGAIGIALGDYDRDGRLDIFINGLENSPNRLYRNEGGLRFTEVSKKTGLTQPAHNGFVAFFTDYNNDAWPDLLVTSLAPWDAVVEGLMRSFTVPNPAAIHPDAVRLFRNNRDGTFTDVTHAARLYHPMGVMGAGVADLDNDGFVDFYFGTGDPQISRLEPNRFFRNNGDGTFSDLTAQTGFARPGQKGHGACFVDIDSDGDLDVYTQLGGHYPGDHAENAFYRNEAGNKNSWLQVNLVGAKSNRFGVGAQITVRAGGLLVHREVKASEGFGSTNPYRQHFGLGRHERVDSIEVVWPSGVRQKFEGVAARRIVTVREDSDSL